MYGEMKCFHTSNKYQCPFSCVIFNQYMQFHFFQLFSYMHSKTSLQSSYNRHSNNTGWLEFNSTFSTKRLYRALQKLKFVKEFYFI